MMVSACGDREKMSRMTERKEADCAAARQKGVSMEKKDNSGKILFWVRITGLCSVLAFACVLTLTVSFMQYRPRIKTVLSNLESVSAELESGSKELTKTLRSLNEQGLVQVYRTLDNIQKINIDRLNESIDSLYNVVNPLSTLFKK